MITWSTSQVPFRAFFESVTFVSSAGLVVSVLVSADSTGNFCARQPGEDVRS